MGNCSVKGGVSGESPNMIRVGTDSGVVLEVKGPKLVKDVLSGFASGYGIFRQLDGTGTSSPLSNYEYLVNGQFYYLLPLQKMGSTENPKLEKSSSSDQGVLLQELANGSGLEVLPTLKNGVWRVKLVINTQQLGEILSEQENTEALIEKMRVAAAASGGGSFSASKRSRSPWRAAAAWWPRQAFKVSSCNDGPKSACVCTN